MQICRNERKSSTPTKLFYNINMAAVSLLYNTNVATLTWRHVETL